MTAIRELCIRCLCYIDHCECTNGPRVQRHPTTCSCSMCDIGRGHYDDHADDDDAADESIS